MFRRPSLADMLSVPEPGVVPPVGGVRVAKPDVAQEEEEASPAEESPRPSPLVVDADADTLIHEPEDTLVTVLNEPEDASASGIDEMDDPASVLPPAIQVPVSAIAVDVPDPSAVPVREPTDAPPGFEKPNRSLDDSWFGEEDDIAGSEDTQPMAEDFIEDPGFADVTEPGGADEIPWANDSLEGASFPKGLVLGAVGLVAAVVLVFFMMSGDKTAPAVPPPAPVAQVQAPPPRTSPPPPPQPVVPPPEEIEGADSVEPEPVAVETTPVPSAPPVSAPVPSTARQATPVQPKPKAKPSVVAAKTAKAKKKPQTADSPWASKTAKPVAPAPASNPWGNPEAVKRGRINITSNVKARVFLDGKNIGNTPTATEADFGPHTVKAEVKGYLSQTKTVNVQSGEVKVPFTLQQSVAMGRCNLLGTAGDVVVMDGRNIGKVPQMVECAGGKHSFKVTPVGGGSPYTRTFESSGDFTNIILRP
jgi:outer membrane biosynthesis protein TonB